MTVREVLRFFGKEQLIIVEYNKFAQIFRGKVKELNLKVDGDKIIRYIYSDDDIYNQNYIKIEVERVQQ